MPAVRGVSDTNHRMSNDSARLIALALLTLGGGIALGLGVLGYAHSGSHFSLTFSSVASWLGGGIMVVGFVLFLFEYVRSRDGRPRQ
jgi:hypothetical protein